MEKNKILILILLSSILFIAKAGATESEIKPEQPAVATSADTTQTAPDLTAVKEEPELVKSESLPINTFSDPTRYTLGPDDVIEILVMRHPEFSGQFPINLEGKIQYKFVGDLEITGLTKKELEQKLKDILANYIIKPEVNVTIIEYRSKVIYVIGEVGTPGKYYMRSETIPVREAVVQAGLPTLSAAMRKCSLITPDKNGNIKKRNVDLYSLLYGGDLSKNIDMHAGDVLYVPATVMAKVIRVINPVTSAVGVASSGPSEASAARTSLESLAR